MKRIWRNLYALVVAMFSSKHDDTEELRYPIGPSEPENVNYPEPGEPVVLSVDEKIFVDPPRRTAEEDKQIFIDTLKELGIDNVQVLDAHEFEAMTTKRFGEVSENESSEGIDEISKHIEQRQMDLYPSAAELLMEDNRTVADIFDDSVLQKETEIKPSYHPDVTSLGLSDRDAFGNPVSKNNFEQIKEPFNVQAEEVIPHITAKPRKRLHWVVTDKDGDHVYTGTNFPEYIKEHNLGIEYKKAYRFSKNKNKKDRLFKGKYKFIVSEQEQVTNK